MADNWKRCVYSVESLSKRALIDEERQNIVEALLLVPAVVNMMPGSLGNTDCLYLIDTLLNITSLLSWLMVS